LVLISGRVVAIAPTTSDKRTNAFDRVCGGLTRNLSYGSRGVRDLLRGLTHLLHGLANTLAHDR